MSIYVNICLYVLISVSICYCMLILMLIFISIVNSDKEWIIMGLDVILSVMNCGFHLNNLCEAAVFWFRGMGTLLSLDVFYHNL